MINICQCEVNCNIYSRRSLGCSNVLLADLVNKCTRYTTCEQLEIDWIFCRQITSIDSYTSLPFLGKFVEPLPKIHSFVCEKPVIKSYPKHSGMAHQCKHKFGNGSTDDDTTHWRDPSRTDFEMFRSFAAYSLRSWPQSCLWMVVRRHLYVSMRAWETSRFLWYWSFLCVRNTANKTRIFKPLHQSEQK